MSSSRRIASFCAPCALLVLAISPCRAQLDGATLLEQDVVGYSDPAADGALFDYRLPTWGYWTNQVEGSLGGQGRRFSSDTDQSDGDDLELALGGSTFFRHESEIQTLGLQFRLSGSHDRSTTKSQVGSDPMVESSRRAYAADADLGARWERYFVPQLAWILNGAAEAGYREARAEDPGSESSTVWRVARLEIGTGIAIGRVRDVTPVLRAERLAERFVALGRPRPSRAQVHALAGQIAQRQRYVEVYERPEKFFWPAVLAELTADAGLTPFEILYLIEALDEPLASRSQGRVFELTAGRSRYTSDTASDYTATILRATALASHNLSLTQQISARAGFSRDETDPGAGGVSQLSRISKVWDLSGSHLWDIADRLVVRSTVAFARESNEIVDSQESDYDRLEASLRADYFVEDHLSLRPWVSWLSERVDRSGEGVANTTDDRDSWNFGCSITYLHDRLVPGLGY